MSTRETRPATSRTAKTGRYKSRGDMMRDSLLADANAAALRAVKRESAAVGSDAWLADEFEGMADEVAADAGR